MAHIDWVIVGKSYGNCNCDYGCPCQFESLPTHGSCKGFEVLEIENGHFGGLKLDGLRAAIIYSWPGPIFEGKGQMQVVIDERADPAQRKALETILHGGETEEAANHWWVFSTMSDTHHPTIYKPISFRDRYRRPQGDGFHTRRTRNRGPSDQEPGHRPGPPGSHRHSRWHRVRHCRNRQRQRCHPRAPLPSRSRIVTASSTAFAKTAAASFAENLASRKVEAHGTYRLDDPRSRDRFLHLLLWLPVPIECPGRHRWHVPRGGWHTHTAMLQITGHGVIR